MFNNTGTKLEETCLTVYVFHLVNTWADDRPIERNCLLRSMSNTFCSVLESYSTTEEQSREKRSEERRALVDSLPYRPSSDVDDRLLLLMNGQATTKSSSL